MIRQRIRVLVAVWAIPLELLAWAIALAVCIVAARP